MLWSGAMPRPNQTGSGCGLMQKCIYVRVPCRSRLQLGRLWGTARERDGSVPTQPGMRNDGENESFSEDVLREGSKSRK